MALRMSSALPAGTLAYTSPVYGLWSSKVLPLEESSHFPSMYILGLLAAMCPPEVGTGKPTPRCRRVGPPSPPVSSALLPTICAQHPGSWPTIWNLVAVG